MMANFLKTLKHEMKILDDIFGKTHDRLQIKAVTPDELTLVFVGIAGKKYELSANVMTTYPQTPPVWFTESDDAVIANALHIVSSTTGTDNLMLSQVSILLKELCQEFNLPEPTHELEQLLLNLTLDLSLESTDVSEGNSSPSSKSSSSMGLGDLDLADSGTSDLMLGSGDMDIEDECEDEEFDDEIEEGNDDDYGEESHFEFGDIPSPKKCKLESNEDISRNSSASPGSSGSRQAEGTPRDGASANISSACNNPNQSLLVKALRDLYRSESFKNGLFSVDLLDDSWSECNIRLKCSDKSSSLFQDLIDLKEREGKDYILLRLMFMDFPQEPPFVRVVHPKMSGSCLISGGVLRIDKLQKGWHSSYSLEFVITTILSELIRSGSRIAVAGGNAGAAAVALDAFDPGEEGQIQKIDLKQPLTGVLLKTVSEIDCEDAIKPVALADMPYTIDMLEALDYKRTVLQLVSGASSTSIQSNRLMCELRMALLVAAVRDPNREKCLMPFPSCFFDPVTKSKDFGKLDWHTKEIPQLSDFNETLDLEPLTWELLHWAFTNPLDLEPLTENIKSTISELETATGLKLPTPDNNFTFMFNIFQTQSKKKFLEAKEKFGNTFFAFHGSPLKNFHSIIHRGLISALNVRSAYGPGTYMSSQLEVSKSYSSVTQNGWHNSYFGAHARCVAICEVVNAPDIKKPESYFVCTNDDYIQLSHILLFKQ